MSKNRRLLLLPAVVVLLAIAVGYVWSGESAPACTPAITTLSPEMNAIGVPDSGDVAITFSTSMDPASYNDTTFVVHGRSSGLQSGVISGDASNLSMTQDGPFAAGEVVTATAATGLQCANGVNMEQGYSWQFTTEVDPNSPGTFVVDSSYSAGDGPWSVFAADLDGDGDLDLATANYSSYNLSVLLNEGGGTFAPKVDYSTGEYPRSVFAADLDSDGDLDLATASFWSNSVSVLLNQPLTCCTGNYMGDFNCDGKVDIGDFTDQIVCLFISPFDCIPCCDVLMDLDYNDLIDIGDLTILINRLFISVTDPPLCG